MSTRARRRSIAVALCALLLQAARCSTAVEEPPRTDRVPASVVVMAPAAAEMLEALGLLNRVVGIAEFGPWPAEVAGLPSVGGYDSPNVEQVLGLGCDLLVTAASESAVAAHARLEGLGVPVLALDTSTHGGVFESLRQVGRVFHKEAGAAVVAREMRERLEALASLSSGLPERGVLFVVGRDPLYVAGPGSHIDEMIRRVGGRNVAHDALTPSQQVSLETILERKPDVIIDTSDNRPGASRGRRPGYWGRWSFLPAVRDDRVYAVEPARLVIPGIRLPEMTELMGRLIHPEAYGEPDEADLGSVSAR